MHLSVQAYERLSNILHNIPYEEEIELYIAADSTWGSSVDDVSAMHCNGDVIAYFGSDLSSSGTIPVIIVPYRKFIIEEPFLRALTQIYSQSTSARIILLYELSYFSSVKNLIKDITFAEMITIGKIPACADLQGWKYSEQWKVQEDMSTSIGGLTIDSSLLEHPDSIFVYIGDKREQIVNIFLRLGQRVLNWFSPESGQVVAMTGSDCKDFQERYGGTLRVPTARTIGIIIGSMGLDAKTTKDIVHRLEQLITASRKKSYCFVMGRLNEAKLCNFPEVMNYTYTLTFSLTAISLLDRRVLPGF